MTTYSKQSEHLEREFSKLQAELAALKAEHARLREAAERTWSTLVSNNRTMNCVRAKELRAALDAGKGEPEPRTRVTLTHPQGICEVCYELNGECSACKRRRLSPPPRETFDPAAVRELLDLIKHAPKVVTSWLGAGAKCVRDSECKP